MRSWRILRILNGTNQGETINVPGGLRLALKVRQPMISIHADDGTIQDFTILKPILEAAGVPCSFAVISSFIGNLVVLQRLTLIH